MERTSAHVANRIGAIALVAAGCTATPAPAPPAPAPAPARVAPAAPPRTWRPVAEQAPFGAAEPLLLPDGRVMIKDINSEAWWALSPDATGDYAHGTWAPLAAMPAGYNPLYFASAVLPDGRVIVEGGEYIGNNDVESSRGAIYDVLADAWTEMNPPTGWSQIGDASGMVLADGTFMLASCCTQAQALLDPKTLLWRPTGAGKADQNSEESWTMLPDGKVLTVDVLDSATDHSRAELYDPATGSWSSAGTTPVSLSQNLESGPLVLRPDGTVLAVGDNGHAAVYDTATGAWTAAADLPKDNGAQLDIADGPGAALPNGNVLVVASPGLYTPPSSVFEWDGTAFVAVPRPPNLVNDPSYACMMVMLPTGEVLMTDFSQDVEIYTPAPGSIAGTEPVITSIADPSLPGPAPEGTVIELFRGRTYSLEGTRLNGVDQGAYYGDDEQAATNFPMVRVTSASSGNVRYYRSHDPSTSAIARTTESRASFDVPADAERGAATLEVVANGVASAALAVDVK